MNDRVPKSLSEALRIYGADKQNVCMVVSEELCGSVSRSALRPATAARNGDAAIARLRKLRDYYRQTHQPREVKAIERAIVVLREAA